MPICEPLLIFLLVFLYRQFMYFLVRSNVVEKQFLNFEDSYMKIKGIIILSYIIYIVKYYFVMSMMPT